MSAGSAEPLVCPRCERPHAAEERFCESCGMPLVRVGAREREASSEKHERARKIRPAYARGEPVKVTGARNLSEAELIQGLLLEYGIPSIVRRTRGFDVPDFLAAGPRDVLVPSSGYDAARELLAAEELLMPEAPPGARPGVGSPARLAAWMLLALIVAAVIVWGVYQVI